MVDYAELEIGLHRRDASNYGLEFRFSHPDADADIRLIQDGLETIQFDFEQLNEYQLADDRYGQHLTENLFISEEIKDAFNQAREEAESMGVPLRFRLFIGPTASELHNLHWEKLHDPEDNSLLLTNENILFSRYLSSYDWKPIRLRALSDLKALVVIANPANLAEYQLAPVDVEAELDRARSGLGNMPITELTAKGQVTLKNIIACLRKEAQSESGFHPDQGGYDILYIVCHGSMVKNESWLWLENENGAIERTAGQELVAALKELPHRPRMVVLVSCQSAGIGEQASADEEACTGDQGALAAIGPQLAEIGVPAVLAMQGNITMQTIAQFMPIFFEELRYDGQIDRAMAVARGVVRERTDWWIPVLFMRLKSGRIWYTPGFGDEKQGLRQWPALINNIRAGRCTPIIGSGLVERLFGSQRALAQTWADKHHFPLAPHNREDLPQVTQYLTVVQDKMFPNLELPDYLSQALLARYGYVLKSAIKNAPIEEMIQAIGKYIWNHNSAEPARVLAELPLPIYITTLPDNFLTEALIEVGKDPQVEFCRWNPYIENLPSVYDDEPDYQPSPERPLVYHLFGRLDEPDSLILTEDDYFDYLIGVTKNEDLVPDVVSRALTDTALLFLGFYIEDWNFRVLFRSVMNQEGGSRRSRYVHVAAQIAPEEGRLLEPKRAHEYLQEAFSEEAKINIYWGSIDEFAREIQERWQKKQR